MGDHQTYSVPGGYGHKATSDSFNGTESVVVYHNPFEDKYLIILHTNRNEDSEEVGVYVNKAQLELLVQSINDVLEMR